MLTPEERRAADLYITIIARADANAGTVTQQVWTQARQHSDEAARIWLFEMNNAVLALNFTKRTRIGTTAQQVLDGRLTLW